MKKSLEESDWQKLSEFSFKEVWDTEQDEAIWRKYLKMPNHPSKV